MTLDPRTQLAQTMLLGLRNQNDFVDHRKPATSPTQDGSHLEQERQSMEALTKALLDPCTTVQEAVLDSLLQRAELDLSVIKSEDSTSG